MIPCRIVLLYLYLIEMSVSNIDVIFDDINIIQYII